MQKNEKVVVEIEDIGIGGEGIGKVDGYTLFVKDAIIGERVEATVVKAKKQYGYAKLIKVIEKSPFRVNPVCPVARQCGGCQIQELSYEKQLEFKENKVKNHLVRLAGIPEELVERIMEPICGMKEPLYYRNKAQFPVGKDKDGKIVTGFYAGRTHQIIPNMDCCLGVPVNKEILKIILAFFEQYRISVYDEQKHSGLIRHILLRYGFKTNEIMVCIIINGLAIPSQEILIERLSAVRGMTSITLNVNTEKTNAIMGSELKVLWGKQYITDYIGTVKFQISPLSFYQVNPVQTEILYETALAYAKLEGEEVVWDLYCGIGTISLFLAQKAKKVYGVEIVGQAIADARTNADINGMKNVDFYVGKAEEVLPERYAEEGVYAEVIVVDPPRKGCEAVVLETIVKMNPRRVVYVSCDSATLGRDVRYLRENGFEVERGRCVDLFPNTVHVETVALLTRKSQ